MADVTTGTAGLADALRGALGAENVIEEQAEREYYSWDLSQEPLQVAEIAVRPGTPEEAAEAVRLAHAAGVPVVPRGGGISYTQGFEPAQAAAVLMDTKRLTGIEINAEDSYVVAGVGVTWEELYLACAGEMVRTPYFGPLSGRFATVGGTLAQNSLFYGSGLYGTAADVTTAVEVALADGKLLRTGSWAHRNGTPFSRYYGPDLTGLFLADTGAMGVKTRAALKLIPLPLANQAISFAFDTFEAAYAALAEMARLELAAELFIFDPANHAIYRKLGFSFLEGVEWSLHATVEGGEDAQVDAAVALLRGIAGRPGGGGREIDPSLPLAMRADPFGGGLRGFVGSEGHVRLPVHGVFPLSRVVAAQRAVVELIERRRDVIEQHDLRITFLTAYSRGWVVFEPVVWWPDAIGPYRTRHAPAEMVAQFGSAPPNPEACAAGTGLRRELAQTFSAMGGIHLQVGKWYPLKESLDPGTFETLAALKGALDPRHLVNPGSLGL